MCGSVLGRENTRLVNTCVPCISIMTNTVLWIKTFLPLPKSFAEKSPWQSPGILGIPQGSSELPSDPRNSPVILGSPQGSSEFPSDPRKSTGILGIPRQATVISQISNPCGTIDSSSEAHGAGECNAHGVLLLMLCCSWCL